MTFLPQSDHHWSITPQYFSHRPWRNPPHRWSHQLVRSHHHWRYFDRQFGKPGHRGLTIEQADGSSLTYRL